MMDNDIEARILHQFETRLRGSSEISSKTTRALLDEQREDDFGDDDELLEAIVDTDNR